MILADNEALAAGDDGAILVFMSGTMEISKAIDAIKHAFSGGMGSDDAYSGGQRSSCANSANSSTSWFVDIWGPAANFRRPLVVSAR